MHKPYSSNFTQRIVAFMNHVEVKLSIILNTLYVKLKSKFSIPLKGLNINTKALA